jgi:hypothetical protein
MHVKMKEREFWITCRNHTVLITNIDKYKIQSVNLDREDFNDPYDSKEICYPVFDTKYYYSSFSGTLRKKLDSPYPTEEDYYIPRYSNSISVGDQLKTKLGPMAEIISITDKEITLKIEACEKGSVLEAMGAPTQQEIITINKSILDEYRMYKYEAYGIMTYAVIWEENDHPLVLPTKHIHLCEYCKL